MIIPDGSGGEDVYWYHFDGLGSVVALSNDSGSIVEGYIYDAFGKCTVITSGGTDGSWLTNDGTSDTKSAYGNPYQFTARRYDNETGLYYYRARMYKPDLGRFLQPDPIGYEDGMNMYAYVGNNPTNFIDPSGLKVFLNARRLQVWGVGGAGVHTFIDLQPDNPKDFAGRKSIILGGYNNKKTKKLESAVNAPSDVNWPKNKLKGSYLIPTPKGMTDTEFINAIIAAYSRYQSESRKYAKFPEVNKNEGNCNNVSTGMLVGAGVDLDAIKAIDPKGFNPGFGVPLPEMISDKKKCK